MSTTSTKITLFDISSALPGRKPASPYTTRVRYALNYKGLPFKTEIVELHLVQAFCKSRGFKHTRLNDDGSPHYTLPVILDETSGTPISVSDSLPIIQYLESTYPDPARPLFPSSDPKISAPAIYVIAEAYFLSNVYSKVFPLMAYDAFGNIIPDESKEYWLSLLPAKLEALALKKGSEEFKVAIGQLKDSVKTFTGFFEHNKGGSWILGDKPTFFDFAVLSYLRLVKLASPDVWKEIDAAGGGKWGKLLTDVDIYMNI